MDTSLKENLQSGKTWKRLPLILLYALCFQVAEIVLAASTIIQFLFKLVCGAPLKRLSNFGAGLAAYLRQVSAFLTYSSNDKPYPLGDWPGNGTEMPASSADHAPDDDEDETVKHTPDPRIGHFKTFAAYNRWANDRLYDAVATLSEEERNKDLGAFFRTLMKTLNHVLVADLLWLERLEGTGPKPESLDTVLHTNLGDLRKARHAADLRLEQLADALPAERLDEILNYQRQDGTPCNDRVSAILAHMFNHQTHHRGQCHHMLSQLGKTPPSLDLIYFIREQG
ncbi:hypothetical protein GCM10007924_07460 [Sneathiella chinensis]|uniref:Damage-inducible protein DinB n=2 Tax=Sneathiella chinensis TaxID=349750 RepID=A0ABQ5U1H6_9PROT|nr:hypothetical protein GCM10007924_07460 [Sneathiella chinensis]